MLVERVRCPDISVPAILFLLCNCFFQFQRSSLGFSVPNSFVPVLCRPCLCFSIFIIHVSVFRKSGMSTQICTKLDEFPPKFRLVRHPMTSRTFKTPFRVVRPGHALYPPRCTSGDPKVAHFMTPVIPLCDPRCTPGGPGIVHFATPDHTLCDPRCTSGDPGIVHFVAPDHALCAPRCTSGDPNVEHFVTPDHTLVHPDAHRVTQTSNIS